MSSSLSTLKYSRTQKGVITRLFIQHKSVSKKRGNKPPRYSKDELKEWLYKNGFYAMWCQWVNSGYDKYMKPSVDRLNDYKGYSLDRIQLVTWEFNFRKGYLDIKNGNNTKPYNAVNQIEIETNKPLNTFHSASEAHRVTGADPSSIIKCCRGKRKTASGFKWEYVK